MTGVTTPVLAGGAVVPTAQLDRPPGERYYRHPGDVVRLVLWGAATLLLILFLELATSTSTGLTDDLGRAATTIPEAVRDLTVALVQVAAIIVPIGVVSALVVQRRWRRTALLAAAAALGAGVLLLLDQLIGLSGPVPGALPDDTWLISSRFPSLAYLAGAAAAVTVGKPWLSRRWRRAADLSVVVLVATMVMAGSAGVPELLLAVSVGGLVGAGLLVALGAPNRRPTAVTVAAALRRAGVDVGRLTLERAVGGRAELYRATVDDGGTRFVKVYGRDSRDADRLYRGYRKLLLRESSDDWPAPAVERDVEHEAIMLLLARRAQVSTPALEAVATLPDGSTALAMEDVVGRQLDALADNDIGGELLDTVWATVARLHGAGLAHRALRTANVLVTADRRAVLIDLGFGESSATSRLQAIDRAELLVSLARLVGSEQAVASASRTLPGADLAAALPYLQPLALSAATRKGVSKATLKELRERIAEATGEEPVPLEKLVRVQPRTLVTIAALTGAFYVLLPQLASVDDSVEALGSANWFWLLGVLVMSGVTYVASAVSLCGGVQARLPFAPTVYAQLASSFVNRVTPANVGGMALNVRFLQKAGVGPADAVTGMGLSVIAGGVVHIVLLVVFFAWAGQSGSGFALPSSSKMLVVVIVILVAAGIFAATRWGRRILHLHVLRFLKQSWASMASLSRSPARILALVGGSFGVTIAYTVALACAVAAFDGGVSFAQVGAVYLGSSLIAAAAPTPGGLGAMEAALVAGFTGIGMDPAIAVAAVLSYRLATYWLPILPGWLSFRLLDRRNYI